MHVLNFNKCQTKKKDPRNCLSWANKGDYRYLLLHWTPWLRNNNNGLLKQKQKKTKKQKTKNKKNKKTKKQKKQKQKVNWKWDKLRTDEKTE